MIAHEVAANGVMIARTQSGVAVGLDALPDGPLFDAPLAVEVEYEGLRLKSDVIDPRGLVAPWRDYFPGVDMLRVGVRVRSGARVLAELPAPDAPLPFMVRSGPQLHVTESYVAAPPALTVTDDRGDVWTMGFRTAQKWQAPEGEFAFNVLRNGIDVGEIASRIERRGGRVRIFTAHGWKVWTDGGFFF